MMPSSGGKRKEIYKYDAPFTLYAMSWSNRPDKKYRLALGSFIEEYSNKVGRIYICFVCWHEHWANVESKLSIS